MGTSSFLLASFHPRHLRTWAVYESVIQGASGALIRMALRHYIRQACRPFTDPDELGLLRSRNHMARMQSYYDFWGGEAHWEYKHPRYIFGELTVAAVTAIDDGQTGRTFPNAESRQGVLSEVVEVCFGSDADTYSDGHQVSQAEEEFLNAVWNELVQILEYRALGSRVVIETDPGVPPHVDIESCIRTFIAERTDESALALKFLLATVDAILASYDHFGEKTHVEELAQQEAEGDRKVGN